MVGMKPMSKLWLPPTLACIRPGPGNLTTPKVGSVCVPRWMEDEVSPLYRHTAPDSGTSVCWAASAVLVAVALEAVGLKAVALEMLGAVALEMLRAVALEALMAKRSLTCSLPEADKRYSATSAAVGPGEGTGDSPSSTLHS